MAEHQATGDKLIGVEAMLELVGAKRKWVNARIRAHKFPAPTVAAGGGGVRLWRLSDINNYIATGEVSLCCQSDD
jgi:predicted DNA-binding transcriptional regulator AlpA